MLKNLLKGYRETGIKKDSYKRDRE